MITLLRTRLGGFLVIVLLLGGAALLADRHLDISGYEKERPHRVTFIVSYYPKERQTFITWYAGSEFDELISTGKTQWHHTLYAAPGAVLELSAAAHPIAAQRYVRCTMKVDWQVVGGGPTEGQNSCQRRYVIPYP